MKAFPKMKSEHWIKKKIGEAVQSGLSVRVVVKAW